jgi:hypothetical protein
MTRIPISQPLTDGYVECDECGHPIEEHTTRGCQTILDEPCPCPDRYTQAQIRAIRKREGLSSR